MGTLWPISLFLFVSRNFICFQVLQVIFISFVTQHSTMFFGFIGDTALKDSSTQAISSNFQWIPENFQLRTFGRFIRDSIWWIQVYFALQMFEQQFNGSHIDSLAIPFGKYSDHDFYCKRLLKRCNTTNAGVEQFSSLKNCIQRIEDAVV